MVCVLSTYQRTFVCALALKQQALSSVLERPKRLMLTLQSKQSLVHFLRGPAHLHISTPQTSLDGCDADSLILALAIRPLTLQSHLIVYSSITDLWVEESKEEAEEEAVAPLRVKPSWHLVPRDTPGPEANDLVARSRTRARTRATKGLGLNL